MEVEVRARLEPVADGESAAEMFSCSFGALYLCLEVGTVLRLPGEGIFTAERFIFRLGA